MSSDQNKKEFKDYVNTTLIGGFLVILPLAILLVVFNWIFTFILRFIAPITKLMTFGGSVDKFVANLLAIIIIILICFGLGLFVKTTIGGYLFQEFDRKVLSKIPFYRGISETVKQLSNRDKMPFSRVVLVDVYNCDTLMTGFITDEHDDDYYTVFVPTGPNPTNGFVFHVKGHQMIEVDVTAEEAMKSIIGVGTGSSRLFKANKKNPEFPKS